MALSRIKDSPQFISIYNKEDIDKRDYFKTQIEILNEKIIELEQEINRFKKYEYIDKYFKLFCYCKNDKINIINCSELIKSKICDGFRCNERDKILYNLNAENRRK